MREPWRVARRALDVTDADVARARSALARAPWRVFNPDDRRTQAALRRADPLVARLRAWLEAEGLLRGRTLASPVVLHSAAGCAQQPWHVDFEPSAEEEEGGEGVERVVVPLSVLVALEPRGTRLETPEETIALARGDVLVWRADVVHAGAAYDDDNVRVHAYLDADGSGTNPKKRARNRTWLV